MYSMEQTDQFGQSYGPASFSFKSRHHIIQLRWAITRWISARCRRLLRVNEDNVVVYITMHRMECERQYWWRYGSVGFGMRNQPYLHSKIDNYTETWYFLIILLVYYCVGICVKDCKLLYRKTKRKDFIFPPSHGTIDAPRWSIVPKTSHPMVVAIDVTVVLRHHCIAYTWDQIGYTWDRVLSYTQDECVSHL
jgi:hypothetical protein